METNNEPPVEKQENDRHWAYRVTPFSKYLTLAMFIILPFLGGWIGYRYASEKVVEVKKTIVEDDRVTSELEVTRSMKVQKGSLEFELVNPHAHTDFVGTGLILRNLDTGEVTQTDYWFRLSERIESVGGESFLVKGGNDTLKILHLTSSGIDVQDVDVKLSEGFTLIEQNMCELGCKPSVIWRLESANRNPVLVVNLYKDKTYDELVDQWKAIRLELGGEINEFPTEINARMAEENIVDEVRLEL